MEIRISELEKNSDRQPDKGAPSPMGDSARRIVLVGRFDAFETAQFAAAINELLAKGVTTIEVDLSEIHFVDSSALAELVRVHKRCEQAGGELILWEPSDPVTVILELTRLDAAFRIERPDAFVEAL